MEKRTLFCVPCLKLSYSNYCKLPREVLKKVLYGEAQPWVQLLAFYACHFCRKGTLFVYHSIPFGGWGVEWPVTDILKRAQTIQGSMGRKTASSKSNLRDVFQVLFFRNKIVLTHRNQLFEQGSLYAISTWLWRGNRQWKTWGSQWLPVSIRRVWRHEIFWLGNTEKCPFSVSITKHTWTSINVQNYWISVWHVLSSCQKQPLQVLQVARG